MGLVRDHRLRAADRAPGLRLLLDHPLRPRGARLRQSQVGDQRRDRDRARLRGLRDVQLRTRPHAAPGRAEAAASLMDVWAQLLAGFQVALTAQNLMWCLVGCALGTAVGVLPGVGPAVTVALLLPITTKVDASGALIMFAGIYYGAMYGGSTTSILLNTPGESATIVTAMEGNQMAKRGRAGPALATSAIGSFVAGTIATIGLTFLSPLVVELGLKFGPPEYFALMVLAFTTVSAVLGESTLRGLSSL